MSSRNPKPRDVNTAVLVFDGDDEIRLRREDEATVAGQETLHTRFIVCTNVGVSTTPKLCRCLCLPLSLTTAGVKCADISEKRRKRYSRAVEGLFQSVHQYVLGDLA